MHPKVINLPIRHQQMFVLDKISNIEPSTKTIMLNNKLFIDLTLQIILFKYCKILILGINHYSKLELKSIGVGNFIAY